MDEQERESMAAAGAAAGRPSRWEWLPAAACAVCAGIFFTGDPEAAAGRFSFFVGLGLLPGTLWRLLGGRSWSVHRVCFAVSLIAFVLGNPELRPDRAAAERIAANWPLVAAGFLASFTQSLWGALRIRRLLVDCGVPLGFMDALRLCLTGSFFSIFLPGSTGGDAYRVYAVTHSFGARLGQAIASVTVDRFLGLPSLILVVMTGMALDYQFFRANRILGKMVPFIAGAGVVCLVLVICLALAGRRHRRDGETADLPEAAKKAGWFGRIRRMTAANVTRPGTLPLALFYGFAAHAACIVSCLCFGLALGAEGVPPLRYFLIVPMAMTINAIPGAPGGIGQGELAMAALLDMASPGAGNAQSGVLIMFLFRLSNMAAGLAGGVFWILGRSGAGRTAAGREEFRRELAESAAMLNRGGSGESEWR